MADSWTEFKVADLEKRVAALEAKASQPKTAEKPTAHKATAK